MSNQASKKPIATDLPKVVVILGPTATGKSDLAVRLAKRFEGEVISADSRQVYKGLNIGTGKITKREMQGIPHHLIDVADPKRQFSADRYRRLGQKAIRDILSRGKLPIICGGTGFYIDTILGNISFPEVKPNIKLRNQLAKKSTESLYQILLKLDPKRAATIEQKNPVRLIRAIEIAKVLGVVPPPHTRPNIYNVLSIGLTLPTEMLKKKIETRLAKRLKAGMLAEAKKLHAERLSWKRMEALGLEYRYEALYFQGKISKEQMAEELSRAIYRYAKRQMTWFKRNEHITWFKPTEQKKITIVVKNFLK